MCGIFGIINKEYSTFNKGLFNTLGIINDTRGGDSCGIFIDGEAEYGINQEKLFFNFVEKSELLEKTNECHLAIGHCRKASVGGVDSSKAQPIIIYDEVGIPEFIVIHNGTIINYEELAQKYIPDINIKGMSDTQVMTQIFYHKGYDVLSEYNGGAVFVIIDYRNAEKHPKVLMWKGVSKDRSYDKAVQEERPFYLVRTENEFVFSSISDYSVSPSVRAFNIKSFFPGENILTLKANTLIELSDNELYCLKTYDRSNCYQTKQYAYTNTGGAYSYSTSYITYTNLREFQIGGKLLHGKKFCSSTGSCKDYEDKNIKNRPMYFYQGVLLYNQECLEALVKIQKAFEFKSAAEFMKQYPEIVCRFSVLPVQVAKDSEFYTITKDFMWMPFTGEFYDIMAKYTMIECKAGKVVATHYKSAVEVWDKTLPIMDSYQINKDEICEQIKLNYNVCIQL